MKFFLFFFGSPAAGKGTQIKLLASKQRFIVLSIGELLRKEKSKKTSLGVRVGKYLDKGRLVPDTIIEGIIDEQLKEVDENQKIIIDGYPRNKEQVVLLDKRLESLQNKNDKVYAICLKISAKEIKRRLGGRRSCKCGATYHTIFNPSKKDSVCDACKQKLFIRADDNLNVIKERIKIFEKELQVLEKYWSKKKALITINGERVIEDVEKDIEQNLKKLGL